MSSEQAAPHGKRRGGSLSEEEPSSYDQDEAMHKNVDEMDSALEMIAQRLERLNARMLKTEKQQVEFGRCAQNCTNKLDASILRHMNTDQALGQLVEEDTRRTQEAQKEYDVLSNILSEGLHKSSGARMFEVLSGVSFYLGIVLSFVFMAPLHAVRTNGAKLLERFGLGTVVDMDADSQPHLSVPILPNILPPAHTENTNDKSDDKRGAPDPRKSNLADISRRRNGRMHSCGVKDKDFSPSCMPRGCEKRPHSDGSIIASDSVSKSDEEFVDALDEPNSPASRDRRQTRLQKSTPSDSTNSKMESIKTDTAWENRDVNGKGRAGGNGEAGAKRVERNDGGNKTCRPGWAIPADDDDDTLMYSKFPSCDLLPLPSDGIKLELFDEDGVDTAL